jgi:hypothetical protein
LAKEFGRGAGGFQALHPFDQIRESRFQSCPTLVLRVLLNEWHIRITDLLSMTRFQHTNV